jgi:hypothetical protein
MDFKEKLNVRMYTGFNCLRLGPIASSRNHDNELSVSTKADNFLTT